MLIKEITDIHLTEVKGIFAQGSEKQQKSMKPTAKSKGGHKEVEPPAKGVSMLGNVAHTTPNTDKLSGVERKKRKSKEGKRARARGRTA